MNTASPTTSTNSTLGRLGAEWNHISIRHDELRRVRSWGLPGPEIASLDDVLIRCGYRPAPAHQQWTNGGETGATPASRWTEIAADDADRHLLNLVAVAHHDPLAARIVLQRILPALCGIARRHSSTPRQRQEVLDDLIGNAWQLIRRYPVERRPRRVAANLVRDIGFETFVRPARRMASTETPMSHDALLDPPHVPRSEPIHELLEVMCDARRTRCITEDDVDFIRSLISYGRPEHMAVALKVTPRTIRNHRDAIVHRLRNSVAA